jgi:hypothetical protein
MRVSHAWLAWLCLVVLCVSAAGAAFAAEPDDEEEPAAPTERPRLHVGVLPPGFVLTGRLGDPAWAAASDSVERLTTIEPRIGEVPTARTVVKVLANPHEIVIGLRCDDPDAASIVAPSKARDAVLDEEDHVVIVLDTFMDGRSGYVFAVNPSGARFDGLVSSQGEEVNPNWDTIWEARTFRDENGWRAEIRISAKSLGFDGNQREWGMNVQRHVPGRLETSRWAGATRDFEVYQTSQSGILTGLPAFDVGAGLSVRPAVVGRLNRASRLDNTDTDGDVSLDMTKTLGPGLLASLTVNTDFAETEVETRQINLTRFPVYFPEKRSFFLAGSDIFEFGLGLDEETLIPFFSRRIGLYGVTEEDQAAVPIDVGGKVSGRIGDTHVGALVVGTHRVKSLYLPEEDLRLPIPATTMGAVRLKQNVLEESSVGMLATFGDQAGRRSSWMGGLDFTYRTSGFMDDKNLLIGGWGLLTDRQGLRGDKGAYGFAVDYPNDEVDLSLSSTRLGDGFDPSLGFVVRNGVHIWDVSILVNHRPLWSGVREISQETKFRLFNRPDNSTWTSYEFSARPLDVLFQSGDRLEFAIEPEGDRPTDTFSISDNADLPAGSYEWTRYLVGLYTAERRGLNGHVTLQAGTYYNGDLTTVEGALGIRPSSFVTLEASLERNTGEVSRVVEVGNFELAEPVRIKEELYGLRVAINLSPDLQITSLTQYDTQSRELGSNNRLRWTFAPQGDLFVVYNHAIERGLDRRWRFQSNQLPVKLQYTWRF